MGNEWTLRASCQGDLLAVSAAGNATPESLDTLRAFVSSAMEVHGCKGLVLDLTQAHTKMTPSDWLLNAEKSAKASLKAPVAMIVREEYFEGLALYSVSVARFGLVRGAFMDVPRAYLWCHAEVSRIFGARAVARSEPRRATAPRLRLVQSGR